MEETEIAIGDDVVHAYKFLNGGVPMNVSKIQSDQALCEHFVSDQQGGTLHKSTWFPLTEIKKVNYP